MTGTASARDVAGRLHSRREDHVQRRERRPGAHAVPQVDREARVTGPQRVAQLAVSALVGLGLRDAVHRESAGAFEQ